MSPRCVRLRLEMKSGPEALEYLFFIFIVKRTNCQMKGMELLMVILLMCIRVCG